MYKCILAIACVLVATSAFSADVQAPAARTIILVRHGNYVDDPGADKQLGPHLSPIGVAQANLVAARLAGLPTRFDAMYVSPVQRARDTAAVIAKSFPGRHFDVVNDLAECTPPTRRADLMAREKPSELSACKAQLDRVFAKYFVPARGHEETDLMVCHGNVIRYLVTRALDVDTKAWLQMSVGNASITKIHINADGTFTVISVGDVGHIPPNLRTSATGDPNRSLSIPALP